MTATLSGRTGNMENVVALITGGAGAIGSTTGEALVRRGASVALADIAECTTVAQQITASSERALPIKGDMTDPASIRRAITTTVDNYGRLDLAVSCAGIASGASLETIDHDALDEVLKANLAGPLFLIQAVAPVMKEQGGGKVGEPRLD